MPNKTLSLLVVISFPALGAGQDKGAARDLFHSAAGLVVPVKASTAPTPKPPVKAPKALAQPAPAAAPAPAPAQRPAAAPAPSPAAPLGLRYSILKEAGPGRAVEVDPDTVFRSGDRIRLAIQANDAAHLYIIQRGSSGNWSVLFPSPEIDGGSNRIEKDRRVEIPGRNWFAFDEQAGRETLFLVLARQPEPNLEGMIYAVRQKQETQPERVLLSQSQRQIDDALVGRVRSQVFSRDLVFEKVTDAGDAKENAVYVVNKAGGADSRVIWDIVLKHQ